MQNNIPPPTRVTRRFPQTLEACMGNLRWMNDKGATSVFSGHITQGPALGLWYTWLSPRNDFSPTLTARFLYVLQRSAAFLPGLSRTQGMSASSALKVPLPPWHGTYHTGRPTRFTSSQFTHNTCEGRAMAHSLRIPRLSSALLHEGLWTLKESAKLGCIGHIQGHNWTYTTCREGPLPGRAKTEKRWAPLLVKRMCARLMTVLFF